MSKLGYWLLVWTICEGVLSAEDSSKDSFGSTLDFSSIYDSGPVSLASNPVASAVLKLDTSQYPQLFDSVISSSIDSLQSRVAPKDHTFSAERFGFNPIASKGFLSTLKSAKLVQPKPQAHHQTAPLQQLRFPLQYDIRTIHDANYKVYKPEEDEQQEILSRLKINPAVASYFKPATTNIEVSHPFHYRKGNDDSESIEQDYKPNAYITGAPRIRRYTQGRKRQRKSSDEEEEAEDPYDYRSEYISKPKAFNNDEYRSAYKEEKDPNKDYEYPYDYDSGYDHKEYERIKDLSEKQAAEIKQNPGNCKEVIKDGMKCTTCKDPKTGGNYESCSYVAEPKNNQYAYSKERKFDSNDKPDEQEDEQKSEASKKPGKYKEESTEQDEPPKKLSKLTASPENDSDSDGKYKSYYVHSSKPKTHAPLRSSEDHDDDEQSEEKPDSVSKPYNYKQALPGFYSDNEPKKDVEHVLAEFKKKDRSTCKKVQKNGMTCFQCIDKSGLKNEECMFVSESAPKRSHLAYQELKEFTSKPATLDGNNEESESQTITTIAPLQLQSAAYVAGPNAYGTKLKRKKFPSVTEAIAATNPVTIATIVVAPTHQPFKARKVKRSDETEGEARAKIVDETNIAPPEEFAGDNSKGAFWAETMPRYSAALGVTLPEYMLARSEHEASFDEAVAGV